MDVVIESIHLAIQRCDVQGCLFCLFLKTDLILADADIDDSLPLCDGVLVMIRYLICGLLLDGEGLRQFTLLLSFSLQSLLFLRLVLSALYVIMLKLELLWACTTPLDLLFQLLV